MSAVIVDLTIHKNFAVVRRATPDAQQSALGELRHAKIRIAQLERNLMQAIKDGHAHYNRWQRAERQLADLSTEEDARESV